MVSINTNANQLSALQLLNGANGQLHEIENRIATGLKVATAKDNGAIWGMAVAARSALGDYEVLDRARDHANGLVDVTLSATEVVSDLVDRMNELALASTDPSLSDTARASLNEQFQMLKRQIDRTVGSASFDGINLLDSNGSNFLDYGPAVVESGLGVPAISWGSPPRTKQEPLSGETLDLHFGFSGSGQQSEQIAGTVTYKLRYIDGGTPVDITLAGHNIPPSTTVGPGLPIYDAAETATMPAIPTTATNVQVYAEYAGPYPADGAQEVADVISNGSPRSDVLAENVPHLLAQWGERDWSAMSSAAYEFSRVQSTDPSSPYNHNPGFQSLSIIDDSNPSVAVSGGTDPGSVISGTLRLSDLTPGVSMIGATATIYYDVYDPPGTWNGTAWNPYVTKSAIATSSIPYGSATEPVELAYSITLPNPAPNEDFSSAQLRAVITTQHDGVTASRTAWLGHFDNTVPAVAKDPRRLETTTKVDTLDGIGGELTSIREKDTRTVGLTGLSLEGASIGTVDDAKKALRYVKAAQARVTAQTLYYAGRADAFSSLQRLEAKIADQTQINLGQLVDADLAKEAARLEAAKVKQSLVTQALSIANSLPAMVLSLFQSGSSRR